MKKKILFLSPMPPPYYGSSMSSEMCLGILKQSKKFEVRNVKLNFATETNGLVPKWKKIFNFFNTIKKILFELKNFKPDLVYFVPATTSFGLIRDYLFVRKIKRYYNGKILFHIRSRMINWDSYFGRKMYEGIFIKEMAIVLDECLKEDLRDLILDKNIFVLPNAIKNEFSDIEFEKIIFSRRKNDKFRILFLSNMDESKGWFKLLEACKSLKDFDLDFECNFIGAWSGPKDEKKFYSFVKKNSLNNFVNYLGVKINKEKNDVLKKSDVLVFPTEYKLETFGRVIIEGMMFGLPVIANRIASIPNIIQDKKTGFILKENSPGEIGGYIMKLKNRKLREKMGIAGRKRFLKNYEIGGYKKKFLWIVDEAFNY